MRSNNFYISSISVVVALAVVALTAYGINTEREGTEYKRESSVEDQSSVKEIREQLAKADTDDKTAAQAGADDKSQQAGADDKSRQAGTDDKSQQVIAADPSGKSDTTQKGSEPVSVTNGDKDGKDEPSDVKTSADPDKATDKSGQGDKSDKNDKTGTSDASGKNDKTRKNNKSGKNDKSSDGSKKKDGSTQTSVNLPNFKEEDGLSWPVSGNVIMTFSTESVVYYETLGQFRASDKILIGAEESEPVLAAADGIVTKVESDRERGNSVTVNIGNGFEVVYGELEDIKVNQGDKVKRGEAFAKVSAASGYYEKEGTNLYFMVKENGEAVNPMYLLD